MAQIRTENEIRTHFEVINQTTSFNADVVIPTRKQVAFLEEERMTKEELTKKIKNTK
jgi:hypothetical protein